MTTSVTLTAESLAGDLAVRTKVVFDKALHYGVPCKTYNEAIQRHLLSNNRALAPTNRRTPYAFSNPLVAVAVNVLALMELSDIIFSRQIGTEDAAGYELRNAVDTLISHARRSVRTLADQSDEELGMKIDRDAPLFSDWPLTHSLIHDHKFFSNDGNELS